MGARQPEGQLGINHAGSGPLNANLGPGRQGNYDQSGRDNHQTNVDTITNYYAPQRPETPPRPRHTVPFTRDKGFVERPELKGLEDMLSQQGARVTLYGLGGVGKSQLAIECCYRIRETSPDMWVLWIHASSAARFDQDIRKLADDVRIPGRDAEGSMIFQHVYNWLAHGGSKWLLVLDNADDVGFLLEAPVTATTGDGPARPRIEYLPPCAHGAVLITSRRRAVASKLTADSMVELTPSMEHAVDLTQRGLGHLADKLKSERLAKKLEYMPLAIAQATAYIRKTHPRCTVDAYIAMLEDGDDMAIQLLSEESEGIRRDVREASNSILSSWRVTFEHLHRFDKKAADLLSLMSFFNHQGIPDSLLKDLPSLTDASTVSLDAAISTLCDYSLISVAPAGHVIEMHRLVQLAAQVWLKQKGEHLQWEAQSLRNLDHAFPSLLPDHWGECRALYPHAKLLLKSRPQEQGARLTVASILYKAAWYSWSQGMYIEAEAEVEQSRQIQEMILGDTHEETLNSLLLLGRAIHCQGRHEEAEKLFRRVLESREVTLGKDHASTLSTVEGLADMLSHQGSDKHQEAEELGRRALDARKRVHGEEDADTLSSMTILAEVLADQGKWQASEELSRRALEGCEKTLGPEHPWTPHSMWILAESLEAQEKYEEAEGFARRGLEGHVRIFGKESQYTLHRTAQLARIKRKQKLYEPALDLYGRALAGYTKALGETHPYTLGCKEDLESLKAEMNQSIETQPVSDDEAETSRPST